MTDREIVEAELDLAERGRRRVLQQNKVLYNDRIRRLRKDLDRLVAAENLESEPCKGRSDAASQPTSPT
jgi:hypothetical protein